MLAFARVAGETAPLIFTAFGNVGWSERLDEPISALPLQIYVYALSPYDEWHRLAWGRVAGIDCADCAGGLTGALCDQPRRLKGAS